MGTLDLWRLPENESLSIIGRNRVFKSAKLGVDLQNNGR